MPMEALARILEQVQVSSQVLNQRSLNQSQRKSESLWSPNSCKCSKCNGSGWIIKEKKDSAPLYISCECRELEIVKSQWRAAGINPDKSNQTFSNFEVWNEVSRIAKDTAISYYKRFETIRNSKKNSIMICGQVGSGKTHLSIALALNFLKKNIKAVYMPYREVITKIKQNMIDEEFYKKKISGYQTCDVLLVDDLFKGKINESDINIMYEILNYRYQNYMPIIVSTEFTVERLLSFDEGIGSRIYEVCEDFIVEVDKSRENNYRLR